MISKILTFVPPKIKGVLLLCMVFSIMGVSDPYESVSDRDILSMLITSECSICGTFEKSLVGSVVLNRVESSQFPNTIRGVVFQDNQFNGVTTSWFTRTKSSDKVASDLLRGKHRIEDIYFFVNTSISRNKFFINYVSKGLFIKAEYHTFKIGI